MLLEAICIFASSISVQLLQMWVCVCVCVCDGDTEGRLSAQIRWCWDTHGKQVNDPWAWLPALRSKILKASRGMDKEDVLPIYNGILLSRKENKIMPFATVWVELEIVIQSEVSQRERQMLFNISCMWNLKQMNLSTKQKQSHRCGKQTCGYWG